MKTRKLSIAEKKGNESASKDCWKKIKIDQMVVFNKNKKSRKKRRGNYISNLKKQDEKLKLKVKLFTSKNGRLGRKINKSASAMVKDESEYHSEESERE